MGLFSKKTAPAPEAAVPKSGGYDFVDIPTADGTVQRMTKDQFDGQPLQERIRVLVQGTASFFRDDQLVPTAEALRSDY